MNIYSYSFNCVCPTDGATVQYDLEISSPTKILAERIREICNVESSHQEDLADRLAELGGKQVMRARHGGVLIETHRP